ncbi:hypothetical protein phiK7A1_030c [Pseudomonas phage phiK7A1]|uniref:Uncharacterized protein n=1 Tax=Pseudomonas phage phiK7A1 TaxID=2759194 RepID=A0A7H0XFN0_9CAUD|nr:hypothetical protein phiK7A1_030c [Pseudomonas phage phiK7A1]
MLKQQAAHPLAARSLRLGAPTVPQSRTAGLQFPAPQVGLRRWYLGPLSPANRWCRVVLQAYSLSQRL